MKQTRDEILSDINKALAASADTPSAYAACTQLLRQYRSSGWSFQDLSAMLGHSITNEHTQLFPGLMHNLLAEGFMQGDEFEKAREMCQIGLSLCTSNDTLTMRARLMLTQAQIEIRCSEHKQAMQLSDDLGEIIDRVHDDDVVMRYNIMKGLLAAERLDPIAIDHFSTAISLAEARRDRITQMGACMNMGRFYMNVDEYPLAMEFTRRAYELAREVGASDAQCGVRINSGVIHMEMDEFEDAINIFREVLPEALASGRSDYYTNALCNLGVSLTSLQRYDEAFPYLKQALELFREQRNLGYAANALIPLGDAARGAGLIDQAEEYYWEAFEYKKSLDIPRELGVCLRRIGLLYTDKEGSEAAVIAEEHLVRALSLSLSEGVPAEIENCHQALYKLYKKLHRYGEALQHYESSVEIHKRIRDSKALASLRVHDALMRAKDLERLNELKQAENNAVNSLLNKMLPESIAQRMIETKQGISDYHAQVSILFADIVGFTSMTSHMPPHAVVGLLNHVFGQFDQIIRKHGCEKIKTIGDGYMAAAGVPIASEDHAERISRAALEMQRGIELPAEVSQYIDAGTKIRVRVGIHCGPAIAGVIGEERFVYDLYSDAVNTAARMEQSGLPGRIHVSTDFAQHLRSRAETMKSSEFDFESREEVEIKGKGKMQTYFLSSSTSER